MDVKSAVTQFQSWIVSAWKNAYKQVQTTNTEIKCYFAKTHMYNVGISSDLEVISQNYFYWYYLGCFVRDISFSYA